jgi:hypothetical protein
MFGDMNNYLLIAGKICGILGTLIYLIFALVIVKQVATMSKNVKDKFNGILKVISYLHLMGAILLLFLALTIL